MLVMSVVACANFRPCTVSNCPVFVFSQKYGRQLFEMLISPSIIMKNSSKVHHCLCLSIVVISNVGYMTLHKRTVSSRPVCFCSQQKGRYLFEMLITPWIMLQNSSKIHHRLRLLIVVISVIYFWESDASNGVGDGRMVRSSMWSWVGDGEIFWCPHLFYLCQSFAKSYYLC